MPAFDLQGPNYGGIEWGQFMHDAAHTGCYGAFPYSAVDGGAPARANRAWDLRVAPNPAPLGTQLELSLGNATPRDDAVLIYAASGRLVRELDRGTSWVWDGRDSQGRSVCAGVYLVTAGRRVATSVVLVR